MRLLSKFACFTAALLMGSTALASDHVLRPGRFAVHVKHGDWGSARVHDIETVLKSVADVLLPYFPQRASDRITVEYSRLGPRILLRKSRDGSYRVLLNVQDTRWDQFAYQFSHELCHILTNSEHREMSGDSATRDHQWFEEALCEAVSLFTLDRMALNWERSPPHPNWEEYAPAFREYANRLLSEGHRHLLPDESIAEWYRANRRDLDGNPYHREKNELLATRLLTLLENTPGGLGAIGYLNLEKPSQKSFVGYLESWYSCCPEEYRAFISQVISLFDEREGHSKATAVLITSLGGALEGAA